MSSQGSAVTHSFHMRATDLRCLTLRIARYYLDEADPATYLAVITESRLPNNKLGRTPAFDVAQSWDAGKVSYVAG